MEGDVRAGAVVGETHNALVLVEHDVVVHPHAALEDRALASLGGSQRLLDVEPLARRGGSPQVVDLMRVQEGNIVRFAANHKRAEYRIVGRRVGFEDIEHREVHRRRRS